MEIIDERENYLKQRHGCVTVWLIFALIINSLSALTYIIAGELMSRVLNINLPFFILLILSALSFFNIFCSILLLKWKKLGFYGFVFSSIISTVINFSLNIGTIQVLGGLLGILIIYAILQIKSNGRSAWEQLE